MFNDLTEVYPSPGYGESQMRAARLRGSGPTRRTVLQGLFLAGAASKRAGAGGVVFLSTQFHPASEAENFRNFLGRTHVDSMSYVTIEDVSGVLAGLGDPQVAEAA